MNKMTQVLLIVIAITIFAFHALSDSCSAQDCRSGACSVAVGMDYGDVYRSAITGRRLLFPRFRYNNEVRANSSGLALPRVFPRLRLRLQSRPRMFKGRLLRGRLLRGRLLSRSRGFCCG